MVVTAFDHTFEEVPAMLVTRWCYSCAADSRFEVPDCAEHGPDCAELCCVGCDHAVELAPVQAIRRAPTVDTRPVDTAA